MAENEAGGIVTLELQVEDTAAEQLEKIGGKAEQSTKKAFSGVEQIIQRSVNKPLEKANNIYAEWGRISKSFAELSGKKVELPKMQAPKPDTAHFEVANSALGITEQKLGNIGAQMGAVSEKLSQTEKEYAKIGAAKGFDSTEAVKLENELTSLQGKLISLQSTAISTEERLSKSASQAAEKAEKAHKKAYDSIVKRAQQAAHQAEQWELRAERARSKSASRAARHAEKAYNRQTEACKRYAARYADAQSDAGDKAAEAMDRAHRKMERASARAEKAAKKANLKMAKDASKNAGAMGAAFQKVGKVISHSLKAVFVTAVLYKFFKAFKENLTGAIAQNKQFAKSMNTIKANLKVAFTPIIEAIMPMITRLAQGLATVTKYIASFIAAIFGKTYKQAVNSTKKLQAQADKAKASTSRDFDELHNVEKNGDGEGSGTDFGALDTSQLDTGPMRKFQEILDRAKETVKELSPAFKNLYDKALKPIGQWVGGKLKDAFSFLGGLLGKLGDKAVKHKESLMKLGDSLGRLWEFLEPILNAAWDTLKALVSGFFESVTDAFFAMADIAPDAIDFVISLFKGDWSKVRKYGKNVALGFWNGLKEQWENTKELFRSLWEGCLNIVKSIFGIHSPSTAFADIGKNLILGLINGIKELWGNLISMLSERLEALKSTVSGKLSTVKDQALSVLDNFKNGMREKCNGIWSSLKEFINKILGGTETMLNRPIDALNKFIRKLNALRVNIPEVMGGGAIGFNIGEFGRVNIPRLARGGIVSKPTLSLIGEAGKEAVVPLQNNTEWMNRLEEIIINAFLTAFGAVQSNSGKNTHNQQPQSRQLELNIDGKTFARIILDLLAEYGGNKNLLTEVE